MKKTNLLLLFALSLFVNAKLFSQCTYTASIAANGSVTGCGDRVLTASSTGNIWTQKAAFGGGGREYPASFSIGAKGYVGTGYNNNVYPYYFQDLWEFDPSTNAWTQKANFSGTGRYGATGFSIGAKGYIGTGYDGNYYQNDFYEYDPSVNTWAQKANFSGSGRYFASSFATGSKGYIATGVGYSYYLDIWEYDPSTNFWTSKTAFPGTYRYNAVGFAIGSKGYVGSGYYSGGLTDFYEFDPAGGTTGTWTQKASLTNGLYGAVGFGIGNYGFVATGYETGTGMTDKLWRLDPIGNTWTQMLGMGSGNGRQYGTGFVIGSKGYVTGGYNSGYIGTHWEYESLGAYAWSNGATTQTISATGVNTYSVLITTAGGCTATASQSVALSPNPTISVAGGTNIVCAGNSNTLTASGATSYTWSANAGSSTSAAVVVTPTIATTYTVSGSTGSCSVDYLISLNVNAVPSTTLAASGPTAGCGTLTLSATGGNTWTQKSGLNVGRYEAVAFSIGGKGYIGTGYTSTYPYYASDFWEYDPSSNAWTQKANFGGGGRYGAVGFSIGSKGYVGTGYGNNYPYYTSDFWEFDPSANTWTQKSSFSGTARYNAVGFGIGTKGYIGTGYNGYNYPYSFNDFYEFDPSLNSWTQKTNFPGTARYQAAGFNIGTKGYIGTGYDGSYKSDFYEFDPSSNSWTTKANFGGGIAQAMAGFSIGSKGYLGTGDLSGIASNTLWEFDQAGNTWTQKASLGGATRDFACGFAIGDKGYIGTGYSSVSPYNLNDLWQYDPSSIVNWSTGSTLQAISVSVSGLYTATVTNVAGCTSTPSQSVSLAPNPTISVIGGSLSCAGTSNTLTASGATTYTWSANAGSSNSGSVVVTPTVATIYTVSGTTGNCTVNYPISLNVNPTPSSSISVSGPTLSCGTLTLSTSSAGNTWTQKAGLNAGRRSGVAFSIGSKGYMGTGYNNTYPYYLNDFWEYDPTSNAWTQKANFTGTARNGAVGFGIGAKGYIGTGYDVNGNYKNDFYEYDPSTNTWTTKNSFTGTARINAVGFSIGTKGYIGTGNSYYYPYYTYNNDFYEYDPSNDTWTAKTNVPGSARSNATGFSIGTKGYIGTGTDGSYFMNDFYEFNPSSNSWTTKTSYGGGVTQAAAGLSIGNKGYIGTGDISNTTNNPTTSFWEFDPSLNTWTQKANFGGVARNYASGFSVGNKGFLGVGYSNSTSPYYMNDLWVYDQSAAINWSTGSTLQAIPVSTSGSYSVTITNGSGCTATGSQSVSLSPNPTISVSGGTNAICSGSSSTLSASGAGTYTWSANAGSSNSASVVVTPSVSTAYTLSGTTGSCTVNYPINLVVNASPVSTIAVSGPTLGCGTLTLNTGSGGDLWTQKAGLNVGRYYAVAFSIGSKGYTGTGYNSSTSPYSYSDFWEYDPTTNAWTQKANFGGGARYAAVGFSIGSKGYIGTGYSSTYPYISNDFWEYDPSANIWTQKANFSGTSRMYATGFGLGTKGYLGTGYSGNYPYSLYDFYEYDPSLDTWTQKTSVPGYDRYSAVGFSIGSKGYVGTGQSYYYGYQSDFYEYDPSTNAWTTKANLSSGISGAVGFSVLNKGYLGSGDVNGSSYSNTFWEFSPTANTWTAKANLGGTSRVYAVGFGIGSKGYLGMGDNNSVSPYYFNDLWQYEPSSTINWSTGSTLQAVSVSASGLYSVSITNAAGCVASSSQSVSLSPNPTISVSGSTNTICGGSSGTLVASGANSYSWSSNAGSSTSSLVVVTPTSSVVYTVAGTTGSCTVNFPVALNVIASPVSSIITIGSPTICGSAITLSSSTTTGDTWTQKLGLNTSRGYGVGFSIGNKGYIGTGYNAYTYPYYYSDFWEYDPATNAWSQKANYGGGNRYGAVGFSVGNKGYVGTGYNNNTYPYYLNDFWEYDPAGNTWTAKTNFPGTSRIYAVGLSIGSKGYIGTGQDSYGYYYSDFYEYNPSTNAWTQKASMNDNRSQGLGFNIGNKGYIGTGGTYSSSTNYDFWEYNPALDTWTQKANAGTNTRSGGSGFSIGNYGFVTGGNSYNEVWQYTQATDTWTQKTNFGGLTRYYGTAFSINSKGYFGMGTDGSYTAYNDFWLYDPTVSLQWSSGAITQSISATTSGTYSLTLTNLSGCTNTSSQALSITPSPTVSISGPTSFCAGGTLNLSASGAANYTWSSNASNATTSNVIVSPTSNASYVVIGATNGCTATASKPIIVYSQPPVTANSSTSSVCQGFNVVLSGGGATSYAWTGGVTNGSGFAPSSTSSYTVIGTDANSCTNTAIVSVTVLPSPTITVNSGSICAGDSFTMAPNGGLTYSYSSGSAVVSPGSTTAYTVTGYNSTGCSNPIPAISNVTVNPLPVITVTDGVVCIGSSYTISPSGASTYTYSSGSPIVSPITNTFYTVAGTSSAGCVSANAAVVNLTVSSLPTVAVNGGTVCNGQNFTLTPTGATTYSYSSGSAVVSPANTTSYSVIGYNIYGCASAAPSVANLTVLVSPTVSVNSGSICAGQSFTMTPTGAINYSYSNGSDVVSPGLTTSYTVTGYNAIGCPNALPVISTVTVNALPVIVENNTVVCIGNSYTLTPTGAGTYTFSSGSNVVTPVTNTSYSITGTSPEGCLSASATIVSLTVSPLPTITVNSGTICSGQNFTMVASGANTYSYSGGSDMVTPSLTTTYTVTGSNIYGCQSASPALSQVSVLITPTIALPQSVVICVGNSYTINPTGAASYTYSSGTNVVSPTGAASYTVGAVSAQGCHAANVVITVSVQPSLNVSISGPTITCEGYSITLTGNGASSYTWSNGSTNYSIVVTPTANATYSVNAGGTNCSGSAILPITVKPGPTVTAVSLNTVICSGETASLSATGADSYSWSDNSIGASIIVTPSVTMDYTVTGSNSNGCTNTAVITQSVSDCLGLSTVGKQTSMVIHVYPNPNNGLVTIESDHFSENSKLQLYNYLGQLIVTETISGNSARLDFSNTANGIYTLQVISKGKLIHVSKLVKE